MGKLIDRILFWFVDGVEKEVDLKKRYFPLSNLLTRLIQKYYTGGKLKFVNIYFRTQAPMIYIQMQKNTSHIIIREPLDMTTYLI